MSEESIFVDALEIADPVERSAYLDTICADDAGLRQRMQKLFQSHRAAGHFLETPAPTPVVADTNVPALAPGAVLDRYRIVRLIGQGGMGAVYLAEQTEPVSRQVALKLIKPGIASPQVLMRFEAERQTLALMDHPHIAKVLDAGTASITTEDHPAATFVQPYFVMEMVHGTPITEYCDAQQLAPRDRLLLFANVCHALHHAHQKGIIHRDLKPSNVLIAEYDGKPVPKVIDFGVAKALNHTALDLTLHSALGMLVGTLEYMSPEQANLTGADVDTRSDVYSLGVLLYQLLTGTTPLEQTSFKQAAITEALRMIRETEPPTPSTRLSHLHVIAASQLMKNQLNALQLSKLVKGELDWIVMKALEKDRTRRYDSAHGFAQDIERYLAHEPVQASPPSTWYRFRKLVRRHRLATAATVLVLATLLAGIVGTTYGLIQARAAGKKAEERYSIAQDAVARFLDETLDDPELLRADLNPLRKKLIDSSVPLIRRLIEQQPESQKQHIDHALALRRLGKLQYETGEFQAAEDSLGQAEKEFRELLQSQPDDASLRYDLARALYLLGVVREKLSKPSLATFEESIEILSKLVDSNPDELNYQFQLASNRISLANNYRVHGQKEKATQAYEQTKRDFEQLTAKNPTNLDYQAAHGQLLRMYAGHREGLQELDQAKMLFAESRQILEKVVIQSDVWDNRIKLWETLIGQGRVLKNLGQHTEARSILEHAVKMGEDFVKDFPSQPRGRILLGITYSGLGLFLETQSQGPEALAAFRQGSRILEKVVEEQPAIAEYLIDLGGVYCNTALTLRRLKQKKEAYQEFAKAQSTLEKALRLAPASPSAKNYLYNTHSGMSRLLIEEARFLEAAEHMGQALPLTRPSLLREKRLKYALLLAQTPRYAEAVQEAKAIASVEGMKPNDWAVVALVCSFAAEAAKDQPQLIAAYSELGHTWLQNAGKTMSHGEILSFLQNDNEFGWAPPRATLFRDWLGKLAKPASGHSTTSQKK